MWFVIGEDRRFGEKNVGWGKTPEEAFEMWRYHGNPIMDTLRWFYCEHPAKVSVIAKYEFKVIE